MQTREEVNGVSVLVLRSCSCARRTCVCDVQCGGEYLVVSASVHVSFDVHWRLE